MVKTSFIHTAFIITCPLTTAFTPTSYTAPKLVINTNHKKNTVVTKNQNTPNNILSSKSALHFKRNSPSTTSSLQASSASASSNDDGKQGLASSTFSLVKAIVGSGVLALPAGVAAIGDVPAA